MNIPETCAKFKQIDLTVNVVKTGDPVYKRGFVLREDGCTIGRITFRNEQYSHIKWYWKGYGGLIKADYIISRWSYLLRTGHVLDNSTYNTIVLTAKHIRDKDLEAKKEWRKANPKSLHNGNHRRKLQGKTLRPIIASILAEHNGEDDEKAC